MDLSKFVLLGCRTHFSIGESIVSPESLIEQAVLAGHKCVAVADTMNINAMPVLFEKAKDAGIRVIIGVTVRVADNIAWRKTDSVKYGFCMPKLYIRNQQGLKDVMNLLSLSLSENRFYNHAQVSLQDFCDTLEKGNVIATTGDAHSVFSNKNAATILAQINEASRSYRLVLEFVASNHQYYQAVNRELVKWHKENGGSIVISRPVLNGLGETRLRDTMSLIITHNKVGSIWAQKAPMDMHIRSVKEILTDTRDAITALAKTCGGFSPSEAFKRAMAGTELFGDAIDYTWEKMDISLPQMSADPTASLRRLCADGWKARISTPTLGYMPDPSVLSAYKTRLFYELSVLKKMGFENYFLLVHYLVDWCKRSGIMVGPGRGSVGGSLVAYLIGITDVDPIRFNLVFERFINPERLDLPDIDLDFMSSRRDEVVDHLMTQFGDKHVAGISNYGTLGSSSSLRSVGSAFGLSEFDFRCSKLVPKETGQPIELEEAAKQVPEIEKFSKLYPEIWSDAVGLQEVFRNYGKHAAGVIVAADEISNRAVVDTRDKYPIVNWDMRVVEKFGLVKLDVLGLQTLDLLNHVKHYVKEISDIDLDYTKISLDDKDVIAAFGAGNTVGVFQFESPGMRHLLKELSLGDELAFSDIVATTALFRPGPLQAGLTEQYVQIRQGAMLPSYPHASMRASLEETHSIIVYQEQVMQIARDLAGFTMAEADKLRKAMGKKLPEEMAKMREKWILGCVENSGLSSDFAVELFDKVERFAGYGFNKSHSVEYTILSYWSMYAKVHHPAAFFAAALTILDEEKRPGLVKNAEASGVKIMPPDINISSDRFEIRKSPEGQWLLYAPFQLVKGISEKGAKAIMNAKAALGRPFAKAKEFEDIVDRRVCNVRVRESLDKIGAFAEVEGQIPPLHPDRLKDQLILLPGLMSGIVRVEKVTKMTEEKVGKLGDLKGKINAAGLDLQDIITAERKKADPMADEKICLHPDPHIGKNPKVFILLDSPNWSEVNEGVMGAGQASQSLMTAIKNAGISLNECYITALVKCGRDKGEAITNSMINAYSGLLDEELEIVNPPVIVAMGGKAIRHLAPEVKSVEECVGQSKYDAALDATIIFGFTPGMIFFKPEKQVELNSIMSSVAHILNE